MSFPNQPSAFRSWTRASDENASAPSGYAAFRMRLGQQPRSRRMRPLGTANPLLVNIQQPQSQPQDRLLLLANVALAMELSELVEAE